MDWDQLIRHGVARRRRTTRLAKTSAVVVMALAATMLTRGAGPPPLLLNTVGSPVPSATVAVTSTVVDHADQSEPGEPGEPGDGPDGAGTPGSVAPRVYLGTSVLPQGNENHAQAVARIEAVTGRSLALNHQYYRWDTSFPTDLQREDRAKGRMPFLNWKPSREDGTTVTWASIASGEQDEIVAARAGGLRDLGVPVVLSFNGTPFDQSLTGWGTAADFVAAFRRVVAVFRAAGATNVAFGWVLDGDDFTRGRAEPFYPGDDVVDWVGAGVFNQFLRTRTWAGLPALLTPFLEWARVRNKLVFVPEFATEEDPGDPRRKAQWFDEARDFLRAHREVQAAVYFNADGMRGSDGIIHHWQVDSSPAALEAWRRLAHDPWFRR